MDLPLNIVLISTLFIVIIETIIITLLSVDNIILVIDTFILIILTTNIRALMMLTTVLMLVSRFCKMTIKPGAQYCGEHAPLPATEQDLGQLLLLIIGQSCSLFLIFYIFCSFYSPCHSRPPSSNFSP